jgi:hypothetical protein
MINNEKIFSWLACSGRTKVRRATFKDSFFNQAWPQKSTSIKTIDFSATPIGQEQKKVIKFQDGIVIFIARDFFPFSLGSDSRLFILRNFVLITAFNFFENLRPKNYYQLSLKSFVLTNFALRTLVLSLFNYFSANFCSINFCTIEFY